MTGVNAAGLRFRSKRTTRGGAAVGVGTEKSSKGAVSVLACL